MRRDTFDYVKKKLIEQKKLGLEIQVSLGHDCWCGCCSYGGRGKIVKMFFHRRRNKITIHLVPDDSDRAFITAIEVHRDSIIFDLPNR